MEWDKLKDPDFKPLVFSMFNINCDTPSQVEMEIKLHEYFHADYSADIDPSKRSVKLDDVHYSVPLVHIFQTASEEYERYNNKKHLEKIAVKENGIHFC